MRVIIRAAFFFLLCGLNAQAFAKRPEYVDWTSPIPRFSELNLQVDEVAQVAGDGLFLLMLNGEDINLWSKGKVKSYSDARITVAATVINASAEEVRKKVLDIKSMPKYMPQISDASIIKQSDEERFWRSGCRPTHYRFWS